MIENIIQELGNFGIWWITYAILLVPIIFAILPGAGGMAFNDEDERCKDLFNNLFKGCLVYNSPNSMTVGQVERIEARIGRKFEDKIKQYLKGSGIIETDEITISNIMKVTLTGYNFTIKDLCEIEQIIPQDDFAQWEWNVTPEYAGGQTLHLHVAANIDGNYLSMPTIENSIQIEQNRIYTTKKVVKNYWKWIIGFGVSPIFVAWLKVLFA